MLLRAEMLFHSLLWERGTLLEQAAKKVTQNMCGSNVIWVWKLSVVERTQIAAEPRGKLAVMYFAW